MANFDLELGNLFTPHDLDALVLAGGESRRMGLPKALLPFGDSTLMGTILAILRPLFRRVVVVARVPRLTSSS